MRSLFSKDGPGDIYQVAAIHRARLLARESRTVRQMRGAWLSAEREIQKRIDALITRVERARAQGLPMGRSWAGQLDRLEYLLAEIRVQADRFIVDAERQTLKAQKASVKAGARDARELVKASGVSSGFHLLPSAAVQDIVGLLSDGSPLNDLFKVVTPTAVADARGIFVDGIAAGDNPREIGRALSRSISGIGGRGILIARTESIRAYTTAQLRNYANNSDIVDGWRWSSSRDGRTCPICLALDGTVYHHGEFAPRHPGCRCATVPIVKYRDRPRGTGEEWLRAQPVEYQKQTLGPARYRLFASGNANLQDMIRLSHSPKWGPQAKLRSLTELKAKIAAGLGNAAQRTALSSNSDG